MQGSGTFAVEAMLTTFVPPNGKVLVLINGAYGQRAKRILDIAGRATVVHETPEDTPPDLAAVERILEAPTQHHPRLRGPLRDDERHPQSDRGDRRARGAPRQAPADRRDERLRRAAARLPRRRRSTRSRPPRTNASRACRASASCSAARTALAETQGQRHDARARPARPEAELRARPASTASRRRSTSSSPSTRRSRSSGPRAASPAAAGAMPRTASILIDGMRGARLRDAAAGRPAGADHRHLPHAARSELRLPALLRRAEGARLRDLSRQAHGRRLASASAASAGSIPRTCAARSPPIREVLAEMGVDAR